MIKQFVAIAIAFSFAAGASAQEPPPLPVLPPAVPVTQPPADVVAATAKAPEAPPRVKLTDVEVQRRLEAIFVMEGIFQKHVALAAAATQKEIENFQPGLRLSGLMFSRVNPKAQGSYLEDYGVFFQVQIPTYMPSFVQAIEDIARARLARPQPPTDPAQPAAMMASAPSAERMMDPDALYVEAVRRYLIDAMLVNSKSLSLRPNEWLTVSARGDDGLLVEFSQPSIMILRAKGSDLIDYLADRISADEMRKRVIVQGFSGR